MKPAKTCRPPTNTDNQFIPAPGIFSDRGPKTRMPGPRGRRCSSRPLPPPCPTTPPRVHCRSTCVGIEGRLYYITPRSSKWVAVCDQRPDGEKKNLPRGHEEKRLCATGVCMVFPRTGILFSINIRSCSVNLGSAENLLVQHPLKNQKHNNPNRRHLCPWSLLLPYSTQNLHLSVEGGGEATRGLLFDPGPGVPTYTYTREVVTRETRLERGDQKNKSTVRWDAKRDDIPSAYIAVRFMLCATLEPRCACTLGNAKER